MAKEAWEKLDLPLEWQQVVKIVKKYSGGLKAVGLSPRDMLEEMPSLLSSEKLERLQKKMEREAKDSPPIDNPLGYVAGIIRNLILNRIQTTMRERGRVTRFIVEKEKEDTAKEKTNREERGREMRQELATILKKALSTMDRKEKKMLLEYLKFCENRPDAFPNLTQIFRRANNLDPVKKKSGIKDRSNDAVTAGRIWERVILKIRAANNVTHDPRGFMGYHQYRYRRSTRGTSARPRKRPPSRNG